MELLMEASHKVENKRRLNKKKYFKSWSMYWNILSVISVLIAYLENIFFPGQEEVDNHIYQIFLIVYIFYLVGIYLLGTIFRGKIRQFGGHFAQLNFVLGLVLVVQDMVTEKLSLLAQPFFVSFAQILNQIVNDHTLLLQSTLSSTVLWLISFVVGGLIGVVLGILMGRYIEFNYWSFPFLKVIGIIPPAALMPITMVIFPSSYLSEIFLIAFSVWFPIAFMTIGGVQSIDKSYFESAKTLGFSESQILWKIVLPGAMPNIFTGIFSAMGLSFTMLVISEMIGAKVGLGWYINWAKGIGNYTQVYAAIVIMAILFSIVFSILQRLQNHILRWRNT